MTDLGRSVPLLAGACFTALALSSCNDRDTSFDVSGQIGADPILPEPSTELLPDMKIAEVVGWKGDETPTVPQGLSVTAYAKDLANPRTVHTLPNGDVLVVQSRGPSGKPLPRPKDVIRDWIMSMAKGGDGPQKESNLITLLRDSNRDGQVDERSDLLKNLHSPFGVVWYDNTLYVAAADAILAYPYQLGQKEITATPTVLTPLPGGPINHHWTKDLAVSADGRFLYASVGSNSNVAERGLEAEKGRAAIWQVDRATGAARIYASGLRNPNGLTLHPETGMLWTVVNERDELGPNLVPDYLTSVQDGGFYGWPWSYFGNHVDKRVHPQRPDMVAKAIKPDYSLSSHVAALGLTFSDRRCRRSCIRAWDMETLVERPPLAKRLKRFLRYLLVRVVLAVVSRLPLGFARCLGAGFGRFAFAVAGGERRKALKSLARAFPEKSDAERHALARASFRHLGMAAFEVGATAAMDRQLEHLVRWRRHDCVGLAVGPL